MTVVEVKRRSDELDLTETDDFIESHLDSYFPPSEEMIEEDSELEGENEELETQGDAESDQDNDGLSNLFEHQNNLSLNREDTDSDGIIDGEEYDYWRETKGKSGQTALSYSLNPDVDDDAISDGKEINGYDAKVITGWTDD